MPPPASVVVPTHGRPGYLRVALASIAPQAEAAGAELLVVLDGPDEASAAVAREAGARVVCHDRQRGLNAARNTGIHNTAGELVVFTDDDVEVRPGWLEALIAGAAGCPDVDCFTGPIRARFEDHAFRMCGREGPPVTFLELGDADVDAPHAWGANLTIRRSAFEHVGLFDEARELYGDELEWENRLRAGERPRIRYLAAAAVDHRRAGDDARLCALMRAAWRRGRASRRFDVHLGRAPSLAAELRTVLATAVHGPRFACMNGPVMAAHSAGRLAAATDPGEDPAAPDFLSGRSGTVGGRRQTLREAADRALDLLAAPARRRVARAAARAERRRVLVLSIVRPEHADTWERARAELEATHHDLTVVTAAPGERGKFENLDAMLAEQPAGGFDWLLVVDDDVALPGGFLDGLLLLCERFGLRLAQPAHRLASHAAWPVTRRRPGSLARQTAFVEIGPVTAFHRETFEALLPFPALRMGWGLDVHWAAVARERDWPIGVVDLLPVAHLVAPAASRYGSAEARAEAERFLASRAYLPRAEASRTLVTHRRLRGPN